MGAGIIVCLDGDGQHDPAAIPSIIRPIVRGEADMVIGSRFQQIKSRIPAWRRAGQHTLTVITNLASGTSSSDSQSGYRAFSSEILRTFDIKCKGFAIESGMQFWAGANELRVAEVPIGCVYAEKAKRNPFRQGLQVVDGIINLVSESRPLLFFGVSGLLTAMVGTGWWWWIVSRFNRTSELALGAALLATLLIILGTLACFQGITLHILRKIVDHLVSQIARSEGREESNLTLESNQETASIMQ
jgi:hypothetical protein